VPAYAGPLAGVLAGLARCETPYLATVPCDTPNFPLDLVERLAHGLIDADGEMAMAFTCEDAVPRGQPVFALMNASVRNSAIAYVRSGGSSVRAWAGAQRCARVVFEDADAFFNANTPADLAQLQAGES
jgi:molybdopterin-guanine dinucleotide biosynthesis protein A